LLDLARLGRLRLARPVLVVLAWQPVLALPLALAGRLDLLALALHLLSLPQPLPVRWVRVAR
jgi:hypothetical protein